MVQTPTTHSGDLNDAVERAQRLERVQHRIYLFGLLIAAAIVANLALTDLQQVQGDQFDRWVLPPAFLAMVSLAAVLWWRPSALPRVRGAFYVVVAALLLAKLWYLLSLDPERARVEFSQTSHWYDVVFVLGFLTFKPRTYLIVSLLFWVTLLLPGIPRLLLLVQGGSPQFPYASTLWHFYTANLVLLLLTWGASHLRQGLTQAHADAEGVAARDYLTGAANRRHTMAVLTRQVDRALREGGELSVLLFDLDGFKQINDQHGHSVGDGVLVEVTVRIHGQLGPHHLLGRWGGDEFVVVAPFASEADAVRLGQELRSTIEHAPFAREGRLTASFGVAQVAPGDTVDTLLHRADAALYRAKANGRNQVATPNDRHPA